ncbi:FFLEELY motif protein [Acinetobacter sp. ULE_I010]|uniref:FFLEELY motif protein n=1 Tax=Acinetobacter sp. ULE_I010 TaxID=3373065 RepID=UPI003AF8625F
MSKLAALDQLLEQYQQLSYHTDPVLKNKLHEAQDWLKTRIQKTHEESFSQKENVLMAKYFMNRLYGGPEFDDLALQIERLLKYAHKAEKIIPENAIKTGLKSVGLAVLAMQLDEQVAAQLLQDFPVTQKIDNDIMCQTLIKLDQQQLRLEQLGLLDDLGGALDKYMRSFIMHTAFKMCRGTAAKYHFELMYDFIGEGFVAMKPMKSAAKFIHEFTAKERIIVENVHSGKINPFEI